MHLIYCSGLDVALLGGSRPLRTARTTARWSLNTLGMIIVNKSPMGDIMEVVVADKSSTCDPTGNTTDPTIRGLPDAVVTSRFVSRSCLDCHPPRYYSRSPNACHGWSPEPTLDLPAMHRQQESE